MVEFYLGSHVVNHIDKVNFPLFLSFRQLRKRLKKPFTHQTPICVDSGGFSELNINGKWTITPKQYNDKLIQLQSIGLKINWAAQQDWMCEPFVLDKTNLSIEQHQDLTVENLIELRSLNSSIHYIPVLQGYTLQDYYNHFEKFESNGFDLRSEPIVGVGSVCRRQSTDEIEHIMKSLAKKGLKLHGFGVKTNGLKRYGRYLKSCDSLAWSFDARINNKKCDICINKNIKNCANCLNFAIEWRSNLFNKIEGLN